MVRPTKEVLDEFYGLAELDIAKRYKSVAALVNKVNSDSSVTDYCVERLVTGLSSKRAAARFGYSTALCLLLEIAHEKWPADKLFKLADKKMDLKDVDAGSAHAVGQHLLNLCIINSAVYHDAHSSVVERELSLLRHFPYLAMTVAQSLVDLSLKLETKQFKQIVLNAVKDYVKGALTASSPEFVYFILLTREKHASVLHEMVPFVTKTGQCKFDSDHYTYLLITVKKCDKCTVRPFLQHLIKASRQSGQFAEIYTNVVEKWSTTGDESKVLERIFDTAELALEGVSDHNEIVSVFSPGLVKRITSVTRGKQGPQQRMLRGKITAFCNMVGERLKTVNEGLLELVSILDKFGNFDQLTGSRLTEDLIARLDTVEVSKWIETASGAGVRRVCGAYGGWSDETRKEVLCQLVGRSEIDEHIRYTVANCVDGMFKMKVRVAEHVSVLLPDDCEAVLRAVVEKLLGKEVKKTLKGFTNKTLKRPLSILWMCVQLWQHLAESDDVRSTYAENAKEIATIAAQESTGENMTVLIDLLIALLGQPQKYHRTAVHFVYANMLSSIGNDDVNHIVDSLMMDDREIAGSSDAEDEDEEDEVTDDNADDIEEDEGVASSAEDEESESEIDEGEEVNPLLVSRLQDALGKAAVKSGKKGDEDEDSDSDVSLPENDDAEMFAMDERLSAAFQSMAPQKKKKETAMAMQAFRMKVTDLLLFTVSAQETPVAVKLSLIGPLLRLAKVQLKRSSDGPAAHKTVELLDIIARLKKVSVTPEEASSLLSLLVEESSAVSNPAICSAVASLAAFIFSISPQPSAFVSLFHQFVSQEDGNLGSQLATAAIYKHPNHFVSELPSMLEDAFNDNYRIFRRTEAILCAASLLTKSVSHTAPADKKTMKKIGSKAADFFNAVKQQPGEVKPRYLAAVLKLVSNAASGASEETSSILSKQVLESIEGLLAAEELWKKELKKCNSLCQQICGKAAVPVLKSIVKSLE